ncbi:Mechanosensitive ion channel-domain-containing protein [Podospora appendiculata]|uniref:Mechanosensitive ion channel protein n=1 Tax=Podospora appendiculata TaxID=314037 RepID=A0AAE0X4P3_9PEZI|nr:Mechanosensitive ion channel-domain-containing protein [Podospora appendiculata]
MDSPVELSVRRPQLTSPTWHVQVPSTEQTPSNEAPPNPDTSQPPGVSAVMSPSEEREQAHRLNDDLELLRAERVVSRQEHSSERSRSRNRSQASDAEDAFNKANPASSARSPAKKTWFTRIWVLVKTFPRVLRYVVYSIPPGLLILIPVFFDLFDGRKSNPVGGDGGVKLLWFGIWLEVVWLTLWAAQILTCIVPVVLAYIADTVGSSNHKKWKDIGRQLEFPAALFLWQLAVLVSYYPILDGHRVLYDGYDPTAGVPDVYWIGVVYKVIVACFIMATLNFAEKILIQWIAASFHLRTYSHRIRENQSQISMLVALYTYAKERLEDHDPVLDFSTGGEGSSGNRTPMKLFQTNARQALSRVGDAANRVAGDLTGRRILKGNPPQKVVLELLRSTPSSYTLARVFYRTFVSAERPTITMEDLQPAFDTVEEAEACFGVFDKDLNGDISMEELEMVCNEIHLEKKAIAASLKDLDSVIKKLDNVFMFIIVIIVIIVFISIVSNSAAAALTSTGTFLLGLSWLLQATAQEFLQSIIFVFVKHPFDVGDRVTIYGNTGDMMKGDDYYVLEISLLYTEFKKMQGHVVQAPNSVLNTIFILNQRRSQGLADPVNLKLRFGTTEAQIEELKARMVVFCLDNKRDYGPRIISEVQTIDEVYSITMNIIFFHKSNYQNELLRITRHNRFAVELMRQMHDMGLEGPRIVQPGGMSSMPLYWSQVLGSQENHHGTPTATTTSPLFPPPVVSPSAGRSRGRSGSEAVVESGMDFQNIYQTRRQDSNTTARLASIGPSPMEHCESSGALDARLEKMQSMDSSSTRRRMWSGGRQRDRSNAGGPAGGSAV